MSNQDETDENYESLEAAAQVLNATLHCAVRLLAKEANISEPKAWRMVLDHMEATLAVD